MVIKRTALVVFIAFLASIQLSRAFVDDTTFRPREDQAGGTGGSITADPGRNSIGMRFVEIPAGSFEMGSAVREAEQPVHRVFVPGFWMGVTEVTQAQWQAVMGSNPAYFKKAGSNAPVEQINWEDAQAFIQKLNALEPDRRYRLPSEAEWEYACRAGGKEETYGTVDAIAWVAENAGGTTHPVGRKQPNAFGLHDMLGNVWEWCQDTWHPNYQRAPADGSVWGQSDSGHVLRGGGWDLPAFFVRAGIRDTIDPVHRLGFRVVYVPLNSVVRQRSTERADLPTGGGQRPSREFPRLTGPYLGQTPPGSTPQLFARGIVSTEADELNAVFTPDGREFYYTIRGEDRRWTIMRMALENGQWSQPRPASFSGRWSDVDMFISADGRRLYFCSNRPLQGDTSKDFDIWVCERSSTGWSEPQNLGEPINSPFHEFYPSLTRDGTIYFQSRRPGGPGASDIWRARLDKGRYVDAECLPAPINTAGSEGDALIAPDESYLIISAIREGSVPRPDRLPSPRKPEGTMVPPPEVPGLFLSLRKPDGTWSPLVGLENGINAPEAGVNCQMFSPDGRYLFFTRGGDIFWIDATVIEDARRRAIGRVQQESMAGLARFSHQSLMRQGRTL
jgi:formylglycine-generating enzyme required for sulfatase activity